MRVVTHYLGYADVEVFYIVHSCPRCPGEFEKKTFRTISLRGTWAIEHQKETGHPIESMQLVTEVRVLTP